MSSSKFDDLNEFFKEQRSIRACRSTNRYGREVIRVNQNARTKLEQMHRVSQISKRSLASYAVALLFQEFEKWVQGNPETQFGYDVEVIENEAK